MRTAEADIILVPDRRETGDPNHWQPRWASRLSTARHATEWAGTDRKAAVDAMVADVAASGRPVILMAHGLGVAIVAHAAPRFGPDRVKGAFLVAPTDPERPDVPPEIAAFAPLPRAPLPFPSLTVASRNDPEMDYETAEDLAYAWGSALVDAGEAGHLDAAAGYGPWPEGLMRLAGFMKRL